MKKDVSLRSAKRGVARAAAREVSRFDLLESRRMLSGTFYDWFTGTTTERQHGGGCGCSGCSAARTFSETIPGTNITIDLVDYGDGKTTPLTAPGGGKAEAGLIAGRSNGTGPQAVSGPQAVVADQVPSVIDVLFVYTQASVVEAGGVGPLTQRIVDSIDYMNQALVNTLVPVTMRLVGVQPTTFVETTRSQAGNKDPMEVDLDRLTNHGDGFLDEITTPGTGLRDQFGADLVHLVPTYGFQSSFGGLAWVGGGPGRGFAISVADFSSYGEATIPHELGHNLGSFHSRQTNIRNGSPGSGPGINYGYESDVGNATLLDIMSYSDGGGVFVPYYSNPSVILDGQPFGIAQGQPNAANNSATFTATAPGIAGNRSTVFPNTAPSAAEYRRSSDGSTLVVTVEYVDDEGVVEGSIGVEDLTVRDGSNNVLTPTAIQTNAKFTRQSIIQASYFFDLSGTTGDPLTFQATLEGGEVLDGAGAAASSAILGTIANDRAGGGGSDGNGLGNGQIIPERGRVKISGAVDGTFTDPVDVYQFDVTTAGNGTFSLSGVSRSLRFELIADTDGDYRPSAGEDLLDFVVMSGSSSPQVVSLPVGRYFIAISAAPGSTVTYDLSMLLPGVSASPPTAAVGGPYTVAEGGSVVMSAAGSTGGMGSTITRYDWDFDYDGLSFDVDATGVSPVFSAADVDGNPSANFTVAVRVTNDFDITSIATTTLSVSNVAPVVSGVVGASAAEGRSSTVQVNLTVVDVSDDLASMQFVFDLDGDGVFETVSTNRTLTVPASLVPDGGPNVPVVNIPARVIDKDGGTTSYLLPLTVTNVAPTLSVVLPTTVNEGTAMAVTGTGSDVTADEASLLYDFDLNGDGVFEILGQTSLAATVAAGQLDGPGNASILVRVRDKDGGSTTFSGSVVVPNIAPTASVTGQTAATQFGSALLVAGATDPSNADAAAGFTYQWTAMVGGSVVGSSSLREWALPTINAGNHSVTLSVTDKDGGSTTTTSTVVVSEVPPPFVTLSGPGLVREGADAVFAVSLSVAGLRPVLVPYTITLAGGAATSVPLTGTLTIPAGAMGGFVRVPTINDAVRSSAPSVSLALGTLTGGQFAGGAATSSTTQIGEDDVGVAGSTGAAGSGGTVSVLGTTLSDVVQITPGVRRGSIQVTVNGESRGVFFSPSRIVADLGAGDDQLTVDPRVRVPVMAFGGEGNDSLVGGAARDILIGGAGRDYLFGNAGENLLVGDGVSYAVDSAQAEQLYTTWNGRGRAAARFAALRATGASLADSALASDGVLDRVDRVSRTLDQVLGVGADQTFSRKAVR